MNLTVDDTQLRKAWAARMAAINRLLRAVTRQSTRPVVTHRTRIRERQAPSPLTGAR